MKDAYGYDVLSIRLKALKGKSVYLPTKFWQVVEEQMSQYRPEVVQFVMSGIKAIPCDANKGVCLVVYDRNSNLE